MEFLCALSVISASSDTTVKVWNAHKVSLLGLQLNLLMTERVWFCLDIMLGDCEMCRPNAVAYSSTEVAASCYAPNHSAL